MNDVEIDSLLSEAGYQYNPLSGRYDTAGGGEESESMVTEDVADQLEIPIDDLLRFEEVQREQDAG